MMRAFFRKIENPTSRTEVREVSKISCFRGNCKPINHFGIFQVYLAEFRMENLLYINSMLILRRKAIKKRKNIF